MVCLGNMCMDTLHKGDNDDDDDDDDDDDNDYNNNNNNKPVYEEGDVPVLWNQEVHTDTEVTANRPDIIVKNKTKKRKHTH